MESVVLHISCRIEELPTRALARWLESHQLTLTSSSPDAQTPETCVAVVSGSAAPLLAFQKRVRRRLQLTLDSVSCTVALRLTNATLKRKLGVVAPPPVPVDVTEALEILGDFVVDLRKAFEKVSGRLKLIDLSALHALLSEKQFFVTSEELETLAREVKRMRPNVQDEHEGNLGWSFAHATMLAATLFLRQSKAETGVVLFTDETDAETEVEAEMDASNDVDCWMEKQPRYLVNPREFDQPNQVDPHERRELFLRSAELRKAADKERIEAEIVETSLRKAVCHTVPEVREKRIRWLSVQNPCAAAKLVVNPSEHFEKSEVNAEADVDLYAPETRAGSEDSGSKNGSLSSPTQIQDKQVSASLSEDSAEGRQPGSKDVEAVVTVDKSCAKDLEVDDSEGEGQNEGTRSADEVVIASESKSDDGALKGVQANEPEVIELTETWTGEKLPTILEEEDFHKDGHLEKQGPVEEEGTNESVQNGNGGLNGSDSGETKSEAKTETKLDDRDEVNREESATDEGDLQTTDVPVTQENGAQEGELLEPQSIADTDIEEKECDRAGLVLESHDDVEDGTSSGIEDGSAPPQEKEEIATPEASDEGRERTSSTAETQVVNANTKRDEEVEALPSKELSANHEESQPTEEPGTMEGVPSSTNTTSSVVGGEDRQVSSESDEAKTKRHKDEDGMEGQSEAQDGISDLETGTTELGDGDEVDLTPQANEERLKTPASVPPLDLGKLPSEKTDESLEDLSHDDSDSRVLGDTLGSTGEEQPTDRGFERSLGFPVADDAKQFPDLDAEQRSAPSNNDGKGLSQKKEHPRDAKELPETESGDAKELPETESEEDRERHSSVEVDPGATPDVPDETQLAAPGNQEKKELVGGERSREAVTTDVLGPSNASSPDRSEDIRVPRKSETDGRADSKKPPRVALWPQRKVDQFVNPSTFFQARFPRSDEIE